MDQLRHLEGFISYSVNHSDDRSEVRIQFEEGEVWVIITIDPELEDEPEAVNITSNFGEIDHSNPNVLQFHSIDFGNWTIYDTAKLLGIILENCGIERDDFKDISNIDYWDTSDYEEQEGNTEEQNRLEDFSIFKQVVPIARKYGYSDIDVEYELDGNEEKCQVLFYKNEDIFTFVIYLDRDYQMFTKYTTEGTRLPRMELEDYSDLIRATLPINGERVVKEITM